MLCDQGQRGQRDLVWLGRVHSSNDFSNLFLL